MRKRNEYAVKPASKKMLSAVLVAKNLNEVDEILAMPGL